MLLDREWGLIKMKMICKKCGFKIDTRHRKQNKLIGIRKKINYPFGKKSKPKIFIRCFCGGIYDR